MADISDVLLVSIFIAFLFSLYKYFNEPDIYWKKLGVPCVPTIPIVGTILESFTRPRHFVVRERYEKYGRIFVGYEGRNALISVADPEHIRNVLVKDFQLFPNRTVILSGDPVEKNLLLSVPGEQWKRIRSLITPSFTTGKIKKMCGIFVEAAASLSKNFEEAIKGGQPVDIKGYFSAFTMDVIASSAFGTKLDSHKDPNNPFVRSARLIFSQQFPWRVLLIFLFPSLFKSLKLKVFTPSAMKFLKEATLEIIEERRRTGKRKNDFLQLLMDASEEELGESGAVIEKEEADFEEIVKEKDFHHEHNNEQVSQPKVYKGLSKDELLAQCVIFFAAGYDTTASTLSFVSYLLALNLESQEILIQEIDEVLRKNSNELKYEAIQNMKYLDNVISETLRLFPPAVTVSRVADTDYKLSDTEITIKRGMIVSVPISGIHYDPEYYPDPEKFDPNRFNPEEKAKRSPYVFLPFGAGPRNCLGMRFALTEIKFCLFYIFSQYRMKRCPQTKVPLEFFNGSLLTQPKEVVVHMEKRNDRVWTA